jgi:hypothetical protein
MRSKLFLAVAVAACGAVVLTSIATAGEAARTRVTIRADAEVHGKVKSPRVNKCADNRKVKVYRQQGSEQNPRTEEVVGSDTSERVGDHGEWNIGNAGLSSGKYYARAGKKPGCKKDASKTIQI